MATWTQIGRNNVTNVDPAVGRSTDGLLELFAFKGPPGLACHIWQEALNVSRRWTNWVPLENDMEWFIGTSRMVVGQNANGRLELFARGFARNDLLHGLNRVWHNWQFEENAWFGWEPLDGFFTGLADLDLEVASNKDGRLELFAVNSDNAVWHNRQRVANNSNNWQGWERMRPFPMALALAGGTHYQPRVGSNVYGMLKVFVRGGDNNVWCSGQYSPNSSNWHLWSSLGSPLGAGISGNIAVGRNEDGRLELFVRDNAKEIWHSWQTSYGWSAWSRLGSTSLQVEADKNITVAQNANGGLALFVNHDNAVWYIRQTVPNNGWSEWEPLNGQVLGNVHVGSNGDGHLDVFVRREGGGVWHTWQVAENGDWI